MHNFQNTLIHCSSLGCLFTEPKLVEDKKKGNLSATAKSHLIKVYSREYWNRERKVTTKQMEKGTTEEREGIRLLGEFDGNKYRKNTIQLDNLFLRGTPDIIHVPNKEIIDLKLSWDTETFLPKLVDKLDSDYYYQLQGYLYLTGMDIGRVSYVLVNASDKLILDEKRRLLYSMDVVSEESPEYLQAAAELEYQMIFDDIPLHEKVINKIVERDEAVIEQIAAKVEKAREYLQYFHQLHINHNKVSNETIHS
jgi:hypothetical protein